MSTRFKNKKNLPQKSAMHEYTERSHSSSPANDDGLDNDATPPAEKDRADLGVILKELIGLDGITKMQIKDIKMEIAKTNKRSKEAECRIVKARTEDILSKMLNYNHSWKLK